MPAAAADETYFVNPANHEAATPINEEVQLVENHGPSDNAGPSGKFPIKCCV